MFSPILVISSDMSTVAQKSQTGADPVGLHEKSDCVEMEKTELLHSFSTSVIFHACRRASSVA